MQSISSEPETNSLHLKRKKKKGKENKPQIREPFRVERRKKSFSKEWVVRVISIHRCVSVFVLFNRCSTKKTKKIEHRTLIAKAYALFIVIISLRFISYFFFVWRSSFNSFFFFNRDKEEERERNALQSLDGRMELFWILCRYNHFIFVV